MGKELILIACCQTKRKGGRIYPEIISPLKNLLSEDSYELLLKSRIELIGIKKFEEGEDLGFKEKNIIELMPAFLRYSGKTYQSSNFKDTFPSLMENKKVAIISALYGLIDGNDLIRYYQLEMDETLPCGIKVNTWWKQHGLRKILIDYIMQEKFDTVHDLLSKNYRKSLEPWPIKILGLNIISYDYPGMGSGSIWHRGNDLKKLLDKG